jgi:sec-independent protein translocase protein TatA
MFPIALERLAVFGFGFGIQELLIIAFIVLILFGSRLPSVMRSLGQGVVEFKKGVQGIDEDKETPRDR